MFVRACVNILMHISARGRQSERAELSLGHMTSESKHRPSHSSSPVEPSQTTAAAIRAVFFFKFFYCEADECQRKNNKIFLSDLIYKMKVKINNSVNCVTLLMSVYQQAVTFSSSGLQNPPKIYSFLLVF